MTFHCRRLLGRERADVDRPILEDRIGLQQSAKFAQASGELLDQRVEVGDVAVGQIAVETADADVVRVHPRAAGSLLEIQDVLAQIEAVKEDRDRTEVDAVRPQPNAVRGDPRQLALEHPNDLRARRDAVGEPEQLLDGERVAERVRRRSEIVHPLDDRLRLRPEEAFGALLDSGVEITDLRIGLNDVLAIDLEYDLQNSVRRWVLRAHREHHRVAGLADDVGHGHHGRAHVDSPSVSTAIARAGSLHLFLQRLERTS